jgi:hypothetical protein
MTNQDELAIGDPPTMAYLERQADIFEQLRSKLVANYLGQYVWLVDEQVIDADRDFATLFDRVVKQVGDVPIVPHCGLREILRPLHVTI